jgi:hypothetical protein
VHKEKKNKKFHVCRNCHHVNWSSKLSSMNENCKCWIIFGETDIKFHENLFSGNQAVGISDCGQSYVHLLAHT